MERGRAAFIRPLIRRELLCRKSSRILIGERIYSYLRFEEILFAICTRHFTFSHLPPLFCACFLTCYKAQLHLLLHITSITETSTDSCCSKSPLRERTFAQESSTTSRRTPPNNGDNGESVRKSRRQRHVGGHQNNSINKHHNKTCTCKIQCCWFLRRLLKNVFFYNTQNNKFCRGRGCATLNFPW